MEKCKQAIGGVVLLIVFIALFATYSYKSNAKTEDTTVYEKVETLEDKLSELDGKVETEKEQDINGDGTLEKLYIVKGKEGKSFLLIESEENIYTKEIDSKLESIDFLVDINSDRVSDIFLIGFKNTSEKFIYPLISQGSEYTKGKIEEGEVVVGVDLNNTVFSMDKKAIKGAKNTLSDDMKKYFKEKGYIDEEGNIHSSNISLKVMDESIDIRDINDDGKSELIINFKILSEDGVEVLSQNKIYNFDITRNEFKLSSIVNSLNDFKIQKELTVDEAKALVYEKTKHGAEEVDYNFTGDIENIPSNIKERFYTFFEVFKFGKSYMESDYLVLVSKDDSSMYKYYVDGLILPL